MQRKHREASQGSVSAHILYQTYIKSGSKADTLLESFRGTLSPEDARRCQRLFYGTLRNKLKIDQTISALCSKPPKKALFALLSLAIFEIIESPEKLALIVDHVVSQAKTLLSAREAGFVNAVLRKTPVALKNLPQTPSITYSHPEWMIQHWETLFGQSATEQFLRWNQHEPKLYFRSPTPLPEKHFSPSPWPHFYLHSQGSWSDIKHHLAAPGVYIQDPSTSMGPKLTNIHPNWQVLDLCAAPGGKSLLLAESLSMEGQIVGVDLPKRCERLRENYQKITSTQATVLPANVLELTPQTFESEQLPSSYDLVYLDVPCSNTGVIQRRPDVKWRLQSGDIESAAKLQEQLINKAAQFLKPQGNLIYSTCSIEPRENEEVINKFLREHPEFELTKQALSKPWETGIDGAGAFLLKKA